MFPTPQQAPINCTCLYEYVPVVSLSCVVFELLDFLAVVISVNFLFELKYVLEAVNLVAEETHSETVLQVRDYGRAQLFHVLIHNYTLFIPSWEMLTLSEETRPPLRRIFKIICSHINQIFLSLYLFNIYLLNIDYVPGFVLNVGFTEMIMPFPEHFPFCIP